MRMILVADKYLGTYAESHWKTPARLFSWSMETNISWYWPMLRRSRMTNIHPMINRLITDPHWKRSATVWSEEAMDLLGWWEYLVAGSGSNPGQP
jgi:hypothetical protein